MSHPFLPITLKYCPACKQDLSPIPEFWPGDTLTLRCDTHPHFTIELVRVFAGMTKLEQALAEEYGGDWAGYQEHFAQFAQEERARWRDVHDQHDSS